MNDVPQAETSAQNCLDTAARAVPSLRNATRQPSEEDATVPIDPRMPPSTIEKRLEEEGSNPSTPKVAEEGDARKVIVADADVSQLDPAREALVPAETAEQFCFAEGGQDLSCDEVMDTEEDKSGSIAPKRKFEVEETKSPEAANEQNQSCVKRQKVQEEAIANACVAMKGVLAEQCDVRQVAAEE